MFLCHLEPVNLKKIECQKGQHYTQKKMKIFSKYLDKNQAFKKMNDFNK